MDKRNCPDVSNLSEEEAWLILLLLCVDKDYHNYELWDQFRRELIYENRFYSEHPIVEELQKRSEGATRFVKTGTTFYRARKYNSEDYRKRAVDYILKTTGKTKEEIKELRDNYPSYLSEMLVVPGWFGDESDQNNKHISELKDAWRKWNKGIRFKGYNGKESTAPPAEKTPSGRANPANIRYLYLCEDKETPIYEMRPIIGQKLSIAKFKLNRDVKIYDLTLNSEISANGDSDDTSLFQSIGVMFSVPNDGQEAEYIPTQFLAEQIKRMGFDGLRFNSSLHSGGINVVLFNPDDCTAVSSDLIEVSDIKITSMPPDIYDVGNHIE